MTFTVKCYRIWQREIQNAVELSMCVEIYLLKLEVGISSEFPQSWLVMCDKIPV